MIINLVPGSLPRYAMPLVAPAAWLLAMTLTADHVAWPRSLGGKEVDRARRFRWVGAIAIGAAAAVCLYATVLVPKLQTRQKIKTIAAQIETAVPPGETLYAVDPDYQPFLFYVRRPLKYVDRVDELPRETRFFLLRARDEAAAGQTTQFAPRHPQVVLRIQDYRNWKDDSVCGHAVAAAVPIAALLEVLARLTLSGFKIS